MIAHGDFERDPVRRSVYALLCEACPDCPSASLGYAADGLALALADHYPGMEVLPGFLEISVGRWLASMEGIPRALEWVESTATRTSPLLAHAAALFSIRAVLRETCLLLFSGALRWEPKSTWHPTGAWECDVRSLVGTNGLLDLEQAALARPLGSVLVELSRSQGPFAVVLRGPLELSTMTALATGLSGAFVRADLPSPFILCRPSASPLRQAG